jgi:sodium transport system ATP-binding protein
LPVNGIVVEGLGKSFAAPSGERVRAVDDVSFSVRPGEVLGLLGPNGAGKTTTLRILATLLAPERGRAEVGGCDVARDPAGVRRRIGYLSASTGLWGRLTPREALRYVAGLQGVPDGKARSEALIERFDIGRFADVPCERLSTGMKQKVGVARALVHDPPVLIFDEPTAGLDVIVADELLTFLEGAREQGRCVLYSTHHMGEAERLCDRLAVIHQGRLHAVGTKDELRAKTGRERLEEVFLALVRS